MRDQSTSNSLPVIGLTVVPIATDPCSRMAIEASRGSSARASHSPTASYLCRARRLCPSGISRLRQADSMRRASSVWRKGCGLGSSFLTPQLFGYGRRRRRNPRTTGPFTRVCRASRATRSRKTSPAHRISVREGAAARHGTAKARHDVSEAKLQTAQPAAAHLTPEEAAGRIDLLSEEDRVRLRVMERWRLGGTDFAERMLLHEAMCQTILGERRCPRDLPMVAFLAMTMRSLASHRRSELGRQVPFDENVSAETGTTPRALRVNPTRKRR